MCASNTFHIFFKFIKIRMKTLFCYGWWRHCFWWWHHHNTRSILYFKLTFFRTKKILCFKLRKKQICLKMLLANRRFESTDKKFRKRRKICLPSQTKVKTSIFWLSDVATLLNKSFTRNYYLRDDDEKSHYKYFTTWTSSVEPMSVSLSEDARLAHCAEWDVLFTRHGWLDQLDWFPILLFCR